MLKKLRIATRESQLALAQTHLVKEALLKLYPDLAIEIVGITTEGDKKLDVSLTKIGGKGLFVKELEQAMHEGKADCAVHSVKDMPMALAYNFRFAAALTREDPRDAFISNDFNSIKDLPDNAVVGTSSLRRQCLIKAMRPDLQIKLLRGNVITRLRKLDEKEYDAIILAAAGLKRLNLESRIKHYFSTDEFIPAAGQGAIGIECVADENVFSILNKLNDPLTRACITAERAVSRTLNASCQVPLGAFAQYENNRIYLRAMLANPENNHLIFASHEGAIEQAEEIGIQVANSLLKQGASSILDKL